MAWARADTIVLSLPVNPLKLANLSLLILFPIAWFAPLLHAGILPFFAPEDISVVSGIIELWRNDPFLAILVAFLAVVAPYAKTISLALIHFDRLSTTALPVLKVMGRLAMADVFLIALYIILSKGIGVGSITAAWGLYLFTACVGLSLAVSYMTKR